MTDARLLASLREWADARNKTLTAAARRVVDVVGPTHSWDELKDAIAELERVLG